MQPNVANVVLGNLHIKPWYPSFYPEDLLGGRRAEWLYVCQWCFKYSSEILKYSAHCVCLTHSLKEHDRVMANIGDAESLPPERQGPSRRGDLRKG